MPMFTNMRPSRLRLFAWQEGEEFLLSPQMEVAHGRRPIQRFDSRVELEDAVSKRGNEVQWLD